MFSPVLKKLPDSPGIYLFYNSRRVLIYVGKATSLRFRVRSYFSGRSTSRPIEQMIHEVAKIKTIKTDSVLEAIILEGNFIKKFRPIYNIDWRDDKSWNYIVITKDPYPRVITVREHELKKNSQGLVEKNENWQYLFGPYPNLNTKATIRLLQKLFHLSFCKPQQTRPCLDYQINVCLGVCTGEISASDYRKKVIQPLVQFLRGQKKRLLTIWQKEMSVASKQHNFEDAGRLRDQIKTIKKIQDIALLNKNFVIDQIKEKIGFRVNRIEGYDISNLGTADKVGGMVVFDESGPVKSEYRKFKIKAVTGQSDVDCLAEVMERRLQHNEWVLPQVFLIDGGLPQVNRVFKIIKNKKLNIPVVGIAKGPERKRNDFFVAGVVGEDFKKWLEENKNLLILVRDEVHRFAIKFNRELRRIYEK